jgi:hypothetical protein
MGENAVLKLNGSSLELLIANLLLQTGSRSISDKTISRTEKLHECRDWMHFPGLLETVFG